MNINSYFSPLFLSMTIIIGLPISSWAQSSPSVKKLSINTSNNAKTKDVNISGQVFIVTGGGSNVKLALISISAFLEKDLITHFDKTWTASQNTRLELITAAQKVKNELEVSTETHSYSKIKWEVANAYFSRANPTANGPERDALDAAEKNVRDTRDEKNINQNKLNQIMILLDQLQSFHHFIEPLKDPKAFAKSDADGNFDLVLPVGIYAIVAKGKRIIGSSTEYYEWIVRVNATSNQKIMLSNDNLLHTKCGECILLPSSL